VEAILVTASEAATLTGLSRSRIFVEIRAGRLESVKIGRARRIRASALVAWTERLAREQTDADQHPAER
jgi:excisionase family DNA binding protein